VTRLNTEPIPAAETHSVATSADLRPSGKIIWLHMRSVADPQRVVDLAAALRLDRQTVTRNLRALADHGLVRQVNGVWISEPGISRDAAPREWEENR
jgi:hypothetical protein